MVGVLPFACRRVDPVIAQTLDYLTTIGLQLNEAAGEGPMVARFSKGVSHYKNKMNISTRRSIRGIVLRLDLGPNLSGIDDGCFPAIGDGTCFDSNYW